MRGWSVLTKALGHNFTLWPSGGLVLLLTCFLAAALARQCFLHPLFLAGFQIKGVTLDFLNDVLLLHFTLEATKSVFQ